MNIFIYSDESGVFDYIHNDYFVFGGLILVGEDAKNDWSRKYSSIEKTVRQCLGFDSKSEIKSTTIPNSYKDKIFRSLNNCIKFGCVINEHKVIRNIWNSKKDKQRFLDYAYKISVKRAFEQLIKDKMIDPMNIDNLYFFVDEHTTATNGRYELRESLEQEFKYGTYNYNWNIYYPPIFPNLKSVTVEFCNSSAPSKRLVRASDIVANKLFYLVTSGKYKKLTEIKNITISNIP